MEKKYCVCFCSFVILYCILSSLQAYGDVSNNLGDTLGLASESGDNGEQDRKDPSGNSSNVYVKWEESFQPLFTSVSPPSTNSFSKVFIAASNDSGQKFGAPIKLSHSIGDSDSDSQIALSGNNVYVTWKAPKFIFGDKNTDVFFAASNDSGQKFGTPINLSNNPHDSDGPKIAISGNNVYAVWADGTPNNHDFRKDVFFAASNDSGQKFGTPINLSNNTIDIDSKVLDIAGSRDDVYVTWRDNIFDRLNNNVHTDVFFAASNDSGQKFGTPVNMTAMVGNDVKIAVSGNNVYAVWVDWVDIHGGNRGIFFAASNDSGQTFSTPINLSNNTRDSVLPQIAVSGNNVYAVWFDRVNMPIPGGNRGVFFVASNDSGQKFGNPKRLSNNTGNNTVSGVQMAVSEKKVYAVWADGTPNDHDFRKNVFFVASNDSGQTFSTPINLSNNTRDSVLPQIAASGNNVYAVWVDWVDIHGGNRGVFFAASNDSGDKFGTPKNLTNTEQGLKDIQIIAR
jgi:hypothetical protein